MCVIMCMQTEGSIASLVEYTWNLAVKHDVYLSLIQFKTGAQAYKSSGASQNIGISCMA